MLRIETAGHSHGTAITGILTGLPAGVAIDTAAIRKALQIRRTWKGRSPRQEMEQDTFQIIGGMCKGLSTGDPLALVIENQDSRSELGAMHIPVPGHGDIGAAVRLDSADFAPARERTSARESAVRVAVGVIVQAFLDELGIGIAAHCVQAGRVQDQGPYPFSTRVVKEVRGHGIGMLRNEDEAAGEIEAAATQGISVGGRIRLVIDGLAPGIGGYETTPRKLDARLAGALMAIQGVKAVEIGRIAGSEGLWTPETYGAVLPGGVTTGMSGGIEAGMSTGGPIEVFVTLKPVSGVRIPLRSQDLYDAKQADTPYIRSDTSALGPALQVVQAQAAFVIADAILQDMGMGTLPRVKARWFEYCTEAKARLGSVGPIVLCGMPASGKTRLGEALARALGRVFLDTDHLVEELFGISARDMIRTQGLEAFRKAESSAVTNALQEPDRVVALGGGALNESVVREIRKRQGILLYLKADTDTLVERITRDQASRPLFDKLDKDGVRNKCLELLNTRENLYKMADIHVPVPDIALELNVDEVLARLGKWRNYKVA